MRAAVDSSPDFQKDFSVVYPLALAYAGPTPPDPKLTPDPINAIWFAARASVVAPNAQYQQQIEKYAKGLYMKYHGGDDGWADVLAQAKANPVQPAGFTIKPAPTPAEQAHNMVVATPPDKMDFATWEFVLSNGSQEDQDAVWNAIKGKPVYMNGTVISATATEFDIAASSDDIDAKKADITLTFEEKVPLRLDPERRRQPGLPGQPRLLHSEPVHDDDGKGPAAETEGCGSRASQTSFELIAVRSNKKAARKGCLSLSGQQRMLAQRLVLQWIGFSGPLRAINLLCRRLRTQGLSL